MDYLEGTDEENPDDEMFDLATFQSGVKKRVVILLLLDTSGSMSPKDMPSPRPIDQLNDALSRWGAVLRTDKILQHRAEIGIITFGKGGVTTHLLNGTEQFTPAALFAPPKFEAGGVTPMLEAIQTGMNVVEQRKKELDAKGIRRFRPLIFMLTDGAPTLADNGRLLEEREWRPTANEIAALEKRKRLAFFAAGVKGANIETLKSLAPDGYWDLSTGEIMEFLRLVSASAGEDDPLSYAREHLMRLHNGGQ